ncbi:MAG: NIPSNAP protein [Chloroflexi bacterium]|jgi:hypothetical protein|nr:MAG: NIPSNAP protein [Chloroflexota bacterium]
MLIEFRTYAIKPIEKDNFLYWFEKKSLPMMKSLNMHIIDYKFEKDNFIWIRTFQDTKEQAIQYKAFFESDRWNNELKDEAYSMINSINVQLFELNNFTNNLNVEQISGKLLNEYVPPGRKV